MITSKMYSAHKETRKPYQGDSFFPEDGVLVTLGIYQDYIFDKQLSGIPYFKFLSILHKHCQSSQGTKYI